MTYDLFLVIGLAVLAFSIPSVVSSYSESRPPRAAAILVMIGGGLIAIAVAQSPITYTIEGLPDVFVRVAAYYLR